MKPRSSNRLVVRRTGLGLAILAGLAALPRAAGAQQIDVAPPLPNVMLLLDTSGSMEKMIDGTDPTCAALGTPSSPNRWGQAIQSITGGISPYYSCVKMSRASGKPFEDEYTINGVPPYDTNYYLPFSRPAALTATNEACVVAPIGLPGASSPGGVGKTSPKALGGSALDFDGAIDGRVLGVSLGTVTGVTSTACQFTQLSNGALDGARDLIRFGLMTFDPDVTSGIGVTTGASVAVSGTPFTGMWSYFPDWNTGAASTQTGKPLNCLTNQLFEVGGRNPAAPPWEGRLIGVPTDASADIAAIRTHNDRIQLAINAMRPYGATPLAGMLSDVKYYYWGDPTGPQKQDVYVQGGCREEYVIVISDGAPNLDARPSCAMAPGPGETVGKCPFRLPDQIAGELAAGTDGSLTGKKVFTYVIGFAVSNIADDKPIECEDLAKDPLKFAATCADTTKQALYGPCCTLEKVAVAGGTEKAYFVKNQQDLSSAMADIIGRIGRKITTRTVPAYSPAIADVSNDPTKPITNAALFLSAFTPTPGEAWKGTVQRTRYVCNSSFKLDAPKFVVNEGDDFAANLNTGTGGKLAERRFVVIEPDTVGTTKNPTGTIRPFVTSVTDGLPVYSATVSAPVNATDAIPKLSAASLKIQSKDCPNQLNNAWLPADDCKKVALDFAMGSTASITMPSGYKAFVSRSTNAFGDIFHATPTVVGPPNALIRDDTYQKFAATHRDRPSVLYAATNDGLLHAFDTSVNALEKNELWALLPPAVLPKLIGVYPSGHTLMLDGAPVVKDTVWDRSAGELTLDFSTKWHTTLVAGFGQAGRGYYALDVTDPRRPDASPAGLGPSFRWQLTDMPNEASGLPKQIFGSRSATAAIGTVFADLGGGFGVREVGVAILPGGIEGGPYGTTACNRANTDRSKDAAPDPAGAYAPRTQVRCWAAPGANVAGRSVSIVRLDNGEILKTFIRAGDAPKVLTDQSRVIDTPLDSPMTGVPVVYPPQVGAVTEKVYIGDADGTVWRFDLGSKDPTKWKGELFFDTVNATVDTSNTAWRNGQPIVVPPAVALDRNGSLVVEIASGDQDVFTATGTNYLYSVSERLSTEVTPKIRAATNWYLTFLKGERVSGPMAVFDGVLYFSTFAAAEASQICAGGLPKVWGRDFVTPEDPTILSKGGVRRLNPATASPVPEYIDPGFTGKIIPGVSINVTPTCANTSISSMDPYVPGATHYSVSNVSSGSPSLLAQVGGQDANGRPLKLEVALPKPRTPTSVDSWAAVVE